MSESDEYLLDICKNGNKDNILLYLNSPNSNINKIMCYCCQFAQIDIVKYIIETFKLFDFNYNEIFNSSLESNNLEIVKLIVSNFKDKIVFVFRLDMSTDIDDILLKCKDVKNYDIIEYLINKYCDTINFKNVKNTYFLSYCYLKDIKKSKQLLELLLKYGNAINNPINIHFQEDLALRIVLNKNSTELFNFLIDYAISINDKYDIHKNNDILFRTLVDDNNNSMVKFLCNYSTDPIDIHYNNQEVFYLTIEYNNFDLMIYLMDYSKSINKPFIINIRNEYLIRKCVLSELSEYFFKYLFHFDKKNNPFDIEKDGQKMFDVICDYKNLELLKYVVENTNNLESVIDLYLKICKEFEFKDGYKYLKNENSKMQPSCFSFFGLFDNTITPKN